MKKYRRITSVLEAAEVLPETAEVVAHWCGGRVVEETNPTDRSDVYVGINVPTMRGVVRASQGDVIVRDNDGFRVEKAHAFHQMYREI